MTDTSKARVREVIREMCAGNSSLAADVLDDEFIFIAHADLPTVKRAPHDSNTFLVDGEHLTFTSIKDARKHAMCSLAVWQFMTTEHDAQYKRLDDLAREFSGRPDAEFVKQPASTQLAILKIIELESGE